MTVPSTIYRNDYTGTAGTTIFPYTFRTLASNEIVVTAQYTTGGPVVLTNYTVDGIGAQTGGDITFTNAPFDDATLVSLTVTRNPADTQNFDIRNQTAIPRAALEDALDRRTMVSLKQQEEIDRSIKFPVSDTGVTVTLPPASQRALKTLAFDASGNVTAGDAPTGGIVSVAMTPVVQASTLAVGRAELDPNQGDWLVKSTGSTTARSLATRHADIINILDWGADSTGAVDSASAINAALIAADGRPVFAPKGEYKVGSAITMPSGSTLFGAGWGSTIIKATLNSSIITGSTSNSAGMYNQSVRDLQIDGTNKATYPLSVGLNLRNWTDAIVSNVLIKNCGNGVYMASSNPLTIGCYYNLLTNVVVSVSDIAFYGVAGANENRYVSCRAVDTGDGWRLTDVGQTHLLSCAIETFTAVGIRINGTASKIKMFAPRLENIGGVGDGINIGASSFECVVIGANYGGLANNLVDGSTETFSFGHDGFIIKSGSKVTRHKTWSLTVDLASIGAGATLDTLVTATGVLDSDSLFITPDANVPASLMFQAIPVAGGNNVYIRALNVSGSPINPTSRTFKLDAWSH